MTLAISYQHTDETAVANQASDEISDKETFSLDQRARLMKGKMMRKELINLN